MTDRLDSILGRLPAPALDHSLDQLEPQVWARIERLRPSGAAAFRVGLRFQLAAAALALVVGMALGWANTSLSRARSDESQLYASYIDTGPMARLENGL
jgi:hypothetical protein